MYLICLGARPSSAMALSIVSPCFASPVSTMAYCRMSKKKKRRHRLGGLSSQNVAVGQSELIVHTVAQDPNVHRPIRASRMRTATWSIAYRRTYYSKVISIPDFSQKVYTADVSIRHLRLPVCSHVESWIAVASLVPRK